MLTCSFIYVAVKQPGRDVGRRMVVARSNCSRIAVESKSNRSYNHRCFPVFWTIAVQLTPLFRMKRNYRPRLQA